MHELNYKDLKIEVEIRNTVDDDIFLFLSKLDLSILEPLLLREYNRDVSGDISLIFHSLSSRATQSEAIFKKS